MRKIPFLLLALGGLGFLTQVAPLQAQSRIYRERAPKRDLNDGYDKYYNRDRERDVYLIENRRPVRRRVFVGRDGRYYRRDGERRVFIDRHYDSYPSEYYYRDGRARPGIRVDFN